MELHYGRPPETADFQPDQEGWYEIRMPVPIVMQIVAFPVGALIFLVMGGAIIPFLDSGIDIEQEPISWSFPSSAFSCHYHFPCVVAASAGNACVIQESFIIYIYRLVNWIGTPVTPRWSDRCR